MQKVVGNSSPIIHLAKIDKLDLLKHYFQTITVPKSVFRECVAEGKERQEAEVIKNSNWIKVLEAEDKKLVRLLRTSLDDGESEAIALSLEIGADLILLDDFDAREKARLFGLTIIGTLGILLRANKDKKIPSLKEYLLKLKETGFWINGSLEKRLLTVSKESL
jgi:predicted nucleic acid-binding protein